MSDTKIQDSPAPEQGAQTPLSNDADNGRVRGGDFDQNTMANCIRGVEVAASSADVPSRNNLNNGAAVTGVAVSVTQVAHKALEGSNSPADFRKSGDTAASSLNSVSGTNKAPRAAVGQVANGKNCR